jgi:hypothetical protein
MLFFIIALVAIIGIAFYVTKNTKSKPTSFLAPGETLTADSIEETPIEPVIESIPEITIEAPVVEAPKMDAKPKKKSQSKKKPATKVDA